MNLDDFEELSKQRHVREGYIILGENVLEKLEGKKPDTGFFTRKDWPTMEEVRAMICKYDPRIALLARDYFDYLAHLEEQGVNHCKECWDEASPEEREKPNKLSHATYFSDISELNVPFNPEHRQFLLFSQRADGTKLFTVDLRHEFTGDVKMTSYESKTGNVSMVHVGDGLLGLVEVHLARLNGEDFLQGPELCEKAVETFDAIINYCRQLM